MNTLQKFEQAQIAKADKTIPEFGPGDTLKVRLRVREGTRERIQTFEGVCIARNNDGLNSSFTVRKISFGEGVERVLPLYSPLVEGIDVARRGDVRRAKLYYLRERRGRAARIAEKRRTVGESAAAEKPANAKAEKAPEAPTEA